jgi:hypothetical protein
VIDYIPLTIEHSLCHRLAKNLPITLMNAYHTSDEIKGLLCEDQAIATERRLIGESKRNLQEIKRRLDTFRQGSETEE